MKTAEQIAKEFVNLHLLTSGMSKDAKRIMIKAITGLLKDQDKITRHACAERINSLEHPGEFTTGEVDMISQSDAFSAVMNTKAV